MFRKKSIQHIIEQAIEGRPWAQERLYKDLSPKMLSVCRMYIKDLNYAEDAMVRGFVKMFTQLPSYAGLGSFEGWVRRIMVCECIDFLRKKKDFEQSVDDFSTIEPMEETQSIDSAEEVEYIQHCIDQLPSGYRLVFNLYAIEGYKHHEIAEMLSISESTSKSQLFKAKKMLQKLLESRNK